MYCWEGHLLLCGSRVEQHQRKGDASGVNNRPTRSAGIIYEQMAPILVGIRNL